MSDRFLEYKKVQGETKGVLRYPGGKTRALKEIISRIPPFQEFREPFVGGGSVFISVLQSSQTGTDFWINDLNYDRYCFWSQLQSNPDKLIESEL